MKAVIDTRQMIMEEPLHPNLKVRWWAWGYLSSAGGRKVVRGGVILTLPHEPKPDEPRLYKASFQTRKRRRDHMTKSSPLGPFGKVIAGPFDSQEEAEASWLTWSQKHD